MKNFTKKIGKNSLKRLLIYHSCVQLLNKMGVEKVFSYTLAEDAGVTADQVRRDFSEFSIKGKKRGGYSIIELLDDMEKILHRNINHNMILVGMGNLGLALIKYSKFVQPNMKIVAAFDIDPSKQKQRTSDIPVYRMGMLREIVSQYRVNVAIIAVPEISAQEVADELIRSGITGIINFAPLHLKVPDGIIINNINMSNEIESVVYYVHKQFELVGSKNLEILYRDMKY